MAQEPDYYAILQVHPDAEPEVIDAAYRRLAAKYHPDVNPSPNATSRMQEINEARRVLSNPALRAAYDMRRARRPVQSAPRPAPDADALPDVWRYVGWFLALVLIGELYRRVGGRGLLILIALAGALFLLFKSRRLF